MKSKLIFRGKQYTINNDRITSVKKYKSKKIRKKEKSWEILLSYCIGKTYNEFLKSLYWEKIRIIILKKYNFCCCSCKSTKYLNVHHKTYDNHFNEHNHLEDLEVLCRDCHKKKHNLS